MSNNFQITQGSGTLIATEQGSGNENYQKIKLIDPTVGSISPIGNAANPMKVDGSAVTQPISGSISISNFPATQPVSVVSLPLPIGAATETTLFSLNGKVTAVNTGAVTISTALPSGSNVIGHVIADSGSTTSVTQAIGTNLHTVVDSGTVTIGNATLAVTESGTWNVTNISGTVSLPTGASTASLQTTGNTSLSSIDGKTPILGQAVMTASSPVVIASNQSAIPVSGVVTANIGTTNGIALDATVTNGTQKTQIVDGLGDVVSVSSSTGALTVVHVPCNLAVTATGTVGSAVTLTLPAVASQFHYISLIEIEAYSTAARTGGVTPVLVTSTNFPANIVWTFASAGAVGTTDSKIFVPSSTIRSSVINTATTIVCPATTSVIWRVNVFYSTGV